MFAALAFAACEQAPIEEQSSAGKLGYDAPDTIYASLDDDATRTYVEQGKYLRWHAGDEISFFPVTYNMQYQFQGETGDNNGAFKKLTTDLITGNELNNNYAVYPYKESTAMSDEGVILFELPAEQGYAEDSFGLGANTMVAITSGKDDNILRFKNACGYLKLNLYGEDVCVKSIMFKGNNDEKIAGAATITAIYGNDPVVAMNEEATTTITLDCGDGVALGTTEETATAFWFVIPATTFEEGFTVTVTDTEGGVFEKSTSSNLTIERNHIQPMKALEVECVPVEVKPANNEIWYTNGSTTEATTPNKTDVFGANIVSNTYDTEKECWVITFDGEVTSIGYMTFAYCRSLTSVTIPDSVTAIGSGAFLGCWNLTSMTVPDSVTTIGNEAFYSCEGLTSMTIPDSVTAIGSCAFYNCRSLTRITIPESVTSIGDRAFYYCTGELIVNCNIPDASSSSDGVFYNSKFTKVTIGDAVTSIGKYAFYNCSSLTSVTIGDSVTTFGMEAFRGCTGELIVNCNIPSATYLSNGSAYGAFYAGKFISVTISDSVASIGTYAFQACSSLTSVTIPDSVTTIGSNAFWGCSSLTSVTIPDSVTTIGYMTFAWCSSLASVIIPDSVASIGTYAFEECSSLTSITIPESVTLIGRLAFEECSSLTSVYCKATTPPATAQGYYDTWSAFEDNAFGRKIYVPAGSVEAYKSAAGWSEYASAIQMSPYIPSECTSLTITADDVTGNDTTTTIYYTAVTNGVEGWGVSKSEIITGTAISDEFPQNPSTTESIERTVSFTYLGQTATTTITQGPFIERGYTISLNNAWQQSTSVSNPDSSLYDGVYESYSNYNVDSGIATMYIDITGYTEFSIYVRSNAESNYDYVTVSELDSTTQKTSTKGNQNSGTALSSYTKVTYTGIDGGSHRITVTYRKDGSVNEGTDRGYLIIPKNQ